MKTKKDPVERHVPPEDNPRAVWPLDPREISLLEADRAARKAPRDGMPVQERNELTASEHGGNGEIGALPL